MPHSSPKCALWLSAQKMMRVVGVPIVVDSWESSVYIQDARVWVGGRVGVGVGVFFPPRCCSSCARVYTLGSKRLLLCMAKSQLSAGVWWCRGRRRAVGSSPAPGSPTGKPAGIRIESQVLRQLPSIRIRVGAAGSWADEKSRGRPPGQRRAPGVRDSGCAAHRVSHAQAQHRATVRR